MLAPIREFEYAAVATNMALDLPALYAFICGRGAQEKTLAELKGEFALDVVPTRHYGANSAWQQLSVLAHNLIRSFQLDTLAAPKPRSRKRTYAYLIRSMRTLRFLLIARAGHPARIGGRHVLRLSHNPATATLYASLHHRSDIRKIIIGRLLEVGGQRGLTTRDAARLADELCMKVFDAATKQTPQRLTLPDFMQHLDRALNIEIPTGALRRQEQAFDDLLTQRLASCEGEELPAVAETTETFLAPVLASRVWPRRSLIDRVRLALEAGIAWIDGSAGMGKTTLVRQAVNGRVPLLWAGLRESTPQVIAGGCRRLVRHIAAGAEAPVVVLDDFNVEGNLRVLEEPLGRLRTTVVACRGALIVVSYRPAGPRIASRIGLPSAS